MSILQSVELDTKRSKGIAGFVLPDPDCIPSSTFDSPLPSLPDIYTDRSISASFSFPPQKTPHRSMLLPGVKKDRAILTQYDKDSVRRGAGGGGYESQGFHAQRQRDQGGPGFAKTDRGGGGGRGGYNNGGNRGGGQQGYGAPQDQQRGSYSGRPSYDQQPPARDPYGGYDSRGNGGGGGGYGGYGGGYAQQQQPPQQPSYGGYGSYAGQSAYQQPPPPGANGGGYRPPAPGGYGAPPDPRFQQQQPPQPYQGYGGYGGGASGAQGYQGQGGQGGGRGGQGQGQQGGGRRY